MSPIRSVYLSPAGDFRLTEFPFELALCERQADDLGRGADTELRRCRDFVGTSDVTARRQELFTNGAYSGAAKSKTNRPRTPPPPRRLCASPASVAGSTSATRSLRTPA